MKNGADGSVFYMVRRKENLVFSVRKLSFPEALPQQQHREGNAAGQKPITPGCRQSVPVRRALRLASA